MALKRFLALTCRVVVINSDLSMMMCLRLRSGQHEPNVLRPLQSTTGTVADTVAEQQEPLTNFQQQVLKRYEEHIGWWNKLTAAEERKCKLKQGCWWHDHTLVIPHIQNLREQCLHKLRDRP